MRFNLTTREIIEFAAGAKVQKLIIAFVGFLIFSVLHFLTVSALTVEGIEQISEFGSYPSWSPDGGKLVFTSGNGIWIMNSDGSDKKKILEESLQVSFPIWSPDGRGILYSKKGKLYYVDISGENKREISDDSDRYHIRSSWSPDGNEIVFDISGTIKLYNFEMPPGSVVKGNSPFLSPDGTKIAFVKLIDEFSNPDIWIINRDGTGEIDVTNTPKLAEMNPTWSPDGKKIAFDCDCFIGPSGEKGIFAIDIDGKNRELLTYYPSNQILEGLSWSPDGTKIAFGYAEFSPERGGIYVIKLGGITPVTPRVLDYTSLSDRGTIKITVPENISSFTYDDSLRSPEFVLESGKRIYFFRNVHRGKYDFVIRKKGYEDYAFTAEVKPGETTVITVELIPIIPEATVPPATTSPSTTTIPPTTLPPSAPVPKAEGKEITSPEDIQTTVRNRIVSTEKLVNDLTELVDVGKRIGADVSAAEERILSSTLILKDANNSYTLALQKLREGDFLSAMNYGNDAYIKGTSGMAMLDEAKPPLYSAIKKKLSDNVVSTESIVNFGKTLMIGDDAEQKLIRAKNEFLAVDSAFKTGDLALAKERILNADKLLSEARMKVYSTFGAVLFLGAIMMGVFLKLRSIPSRPKAREAKGDEVKITVLKQEPLAATVKAISVIGLSKSYKKSVILENVGFEIDQGTLCGIVGSSGGGKSTLIEGIAGRTPPDKGDIKILGIDTKKDRMRINQLVGFVPQHPELYLDQTVWQNMMNSALKWSVKDAEAKSEKILKQLDIYGRKDVIAKNLSGGQLKRLSLGMELIREPPILVLDEPTTGLDPTSRDQILTALSKVVTSEKRTVVFTTHFMDEAEHCDEVIIVGNAQILAKGQPSELARKMPGGGKVVNITLEEVSENLVSRVSGLEGVRKVIREGRVLKIIMDYPDPVTVSQKVKEFGGVVEEAKIAKAGMKEVFVYYTGVYPEDVK